jgi:hypothetical protein
MARKRKSLSAAVDKELKSKFDLGSFKDKKGLASNVKFKSQDWIPLSPAFQNVTSIPGIPMGHIVLLRGREVKEIFDEETGELIDYEGNFLYVDRETINTIEDVAAFILDMMDEQKKGNLPYDLLFLWDSIGSIPCEMSVKSNKNNNEWNAGAMSTQFGNNVNQRITLSRKESSKYTNTLVCVNKVWAAKPVVPMGQPKMMNKGGFAMWFDSTFVVTFGNISDSGTSKLKAIKDGKQVEFAKRTNLQIDKNHINGIQSRGRIIMTPHGFIQDNDKDLKSYKESHTKEWQEILGGKDFNIIEEESSNVNAEAFTSEPSE